MLDAPCTNRHNVDIKDRVKALREKLGLSQVKLAELAGFSSQSLVGKIETGANRASSYETRAGLARGFGLPFEMLVGYLEGDFPLDEVAALATPPLKGANQSPKAPAAPRSAQEAARDAVPAALLAAFEDCLVELMDPQEFKLADQDAVRGVFPMGAAVLPPDTDLVETVRGWLVAARELRLEGKEANPFAIAFRASASADSFEQAIERARHAGAVRAKRPAPGKPDKT